MNDLLADLQADLGAPAALPTAPARPAAPAPSRTTPAFEVCVTPLRWSLPGLRLDDGLSLRVGPVRVGLTRR